MIAPLLRYEREDYYVHCDGALFAMMMPFVEYAHPSVHLRRPMDWIQIASPTTDGCRLHLGCICSASGVHLRAPSKDL